MVDNVQILIPLTGMLVGTIFPVVVVWLVLRFRAQRNQLVYDTAVKLADKGQPVPPELFANLNPTGSDLRRGLVLAMFGLALSICLYDVGAPWTFGLIPLLMGVGFLIVWQLEKRGTGQH
jgi:hypothetical protein